MREVKEQGGFVFQLSRPTSPKCVYALLITYYESLVIFRRRRVLCDALPGVLVLPHKSTKCNHLASRLA